MEIFVQEYTEMEIYPGSKPATLKPERSTGEPFWKTPRFHPRLIERQDFFSQDLWGAGAGLAWVRSSWSSFAAGPCHSTPARPLGMEVCGVLDSWEARSPATARIVEFCPILVVGKVSCIKVKLLGWWDALQRNPARDLQF